MTNKELYEDFMKYEEHPFRKILDDVKGKYISIWNSTVLSSSNRLYKNVHFESIDDDVVVFEGDEVWGYGGCHSHTVHIPLKYFIAEDIDAELENFHQERLQLVKVYNQYQQKKELDKKEQRRLQYEKLKQEFE